MDLQKNKRFRELINGPEIISIPTCYDVLSARIMEYVGFEVIGMGGNSGMCSAIGYPDIGIATQTEMIDRARNVAARISVPMYCDADTGYGPPNNLKRTVLDFEAAGVSAIHLEDQTDPKKCGAMEGVSVISAEEMVDKIRLAVKTRRDPNFMIIGRTDCFGTMGIDEVIRRMKMYADAGADILMPENIYDPELMRRIGREVTTAPLLYDIIDSSNMRMTNEEIYDMGYKIVCRSLSFVLRISRALKEMLTYLKENGRLDDYADMLLDIRELERIVGLEEELEVLKNFGS